MINQEPILWPEHASVCLDDGKINLPDKCPIPFPGYVIKPGHPFFYQQTLTHPAHNVSPNVGIYSFGDSPDAFRVNLKKMGPGWHYANKRVEYHCNSDGYRAPEWNQIDWANSIVVIGCSMTFGTGLAQDETLSHCIQEITGRPTINLGYPSASNELLLNNAAALYENFGKPYAVVINWTCLDRFPFYASYPHCVGLWTTDEAEAEGVNLYKLYKMRNYSERNRITESYYLAKTARVMWQDRTRYVTMSYFAGTAHYMRTDGYISIDKQPLSERSRDLIHPGIVSMKAAAQLIVEKLKTCPAS